MNIKIADFGLATQINDDKKHFTMCGTPNFISPEIASRNAHGLEADVWSLGCMMYTFLTGKPPFDTEGIRNTLNKVVLAEFEMPKYLSPEAQDLISCLLRKNPMDRIPLSKVLEHPFMTKTRKMIPTLLPSSSSSSFKPINSFNESIDSGRGTMTATNTSRSPLGGQMGRNLPTLQSGQEQDFNTANTINKLNTVGFTNSSSFVAGNSVMHNNINQSSSSSSSSSHSASSSQINHFSSSHSTNAQQHQYNQHIHHNQIQNPQPHLDAADSSKNLYYNRFLKQHQIDMNTPPSPPVKLSSYSPTKQQKCPLMSSSTTSLSTSSNQYQQQGYHQGSSIATYQQLSRSNSNINSIANSGNHYTHVQSMAANQHHQQNQAYPISSTQYNNNGKFIYFIID